MELTSNIKLSGFTLDETDTVYIIYLNKPSDTLTIEGMANGDDTSQLYLSQSAATAMDADIVIPAANRQYHISDARYETKKSPCGKCLFRSNKVETLVGCSVNGVAQGTDITLTK